MCDSTDTAGGWRRSPWRPAMWGAAALLLAVPAVAMRFTREVRWDAADFIVMGALLALACGAVDAGMRLSGHRAYRAGVVVAVGGSFLLLWINMAVGILGSEDNPANLLYAGVLGVGAVGAVLARARPAGLARTLLAMAAAQVLVPVVAMALGPVGSPPLQVLGVTAFFLGPWLLAAALFHVAARAAAGPAAGASGAPSGGRPRLVQGIAIGVLGAGLALTAFMVLTEGEPGALPLALVLLGLAGLAVARRRRPGPRG